MELQKEESFQQSSAKQIRSVAKALMTIDLLMANPEGLSLSEISKNLQISRSTIHGILSTMRDFGYIDQSLVNGHYKLGLRLFEAGNVIINNLDVRRVAAPYVNDLVEKVNETVHLAVLKDGEVLYIDKRECGQSIRIVSEVGSRLPVHCTGVGKLLLAYLSDSEVKHIVSTKGLRRYTKHTITSLPGLVKELADIRTQGFSLDNQEIMEGLSCVAAPVRNYENKVCAALSVSGVTVRMKERISEIIELVANTAESISFDMGYRKGDSL